jgi:hypothetical protein
MMFIPPAPGIYPGFGQSPQFKRDMFIMKWAMIAALVLFVGFMVVAVWGSL